MNSLDQTPQNWLAIRWFKLRVKLANKLVKLAHKVRPKTANQMMQMIEDEFMFGTGIGRIDPKSVFKDSDMVATDKDVK